MGVRVPYVGRLARGRSSVALLVALVCAVAVGTAAPVAKANTTCGGYSVTNTTQTAYGANEKVVIDVWGSSAPNPSSVVIGGTQWSFSSSTRYSDHISSTWVHAYLAQGTWSFWLTVNGQLCSNGTFTIT
jgi:hypothetical protein